MRTLTHWLIDMPERLSAVFSWLPPLVARIVVGWVFLWTGWAKLNNLPQMIQNFTDWGIPFPHIMTPFVSGVEFLGGLLLLLGLFTRLAATPLVVVMAVAVIAAKLDQIDSLETLLGFEEVAYMALFGWLAVAGPGPVSLDRLLQHAFSDASRGNPRRV
ncbi:MAG: DoxX family protein [Hyphomicrobium sp.]|uniref:DoxX family protein n=1 Tax=Hyphomicrobium sp. TaxID=82 RepID=UPI003D132D45